MARKPSATTEARQRRVLNAYRLNDFRWRLQIGAPFLLMIFVHPLLAVILAPIATYFVPPVLFNRSRYAKARALIATLGSVNLLMFNGLTIAMGTLYCGAFFPAFKPYCGIAALVLTMLYILWIVLTPHPAKKNINFRRLIFKLFPNQGFGDTKDR